MASEEAVLAELVNNNNELKMDGVVDGETSGHLDLRHKDTFFRGEWLKDKESFDDEDCDVIENFMRSSSDEVSD